MQTIQVKTDLGIVEGESKSSCMIFRGVPYAEAPVKQRRFKVPMKKSSWDGVLNCTEFQRQCPQADPKSGFYGKEFYTDKNFPLPKMNEDCLYLNIWAPNKPGKYPVAFWVHGGAFDHGFGSEMEFDGEKFAQRDVILVTINYRVGVFGFYADPCLVRENAHHTTGNYGLLDQVCALQWVYDNIHSFNGDNKRITVFGQSAGAISVQALCTTPLTRGLINNAIIQSGGGIDNGLMRTRTLDEAFETGKKINEMIGTTAISELRRASAKRMVELLPELYKESNGLVFGPCKDDYFLYEDMDSAARNNRILDIPYIIGMCGNDITVGEGQRYRDSKLYEGCINFCEARAAYSEKPVYMYVFDHKLPSDDAGAFHSSELWYTFGTYERCWRDMGTRDYRLSNTMMDAWCNFIKTSDPGAQWRPYTSKGQFIRNFL